MPTSKERKTHVLKTPEACRPRLVCGEDALADEISLKFCKLIKKSGFSENFDAKTGDARRDSAYTWTASAFLVLAHELG